jgi:hypothetical protein
MNYNQDYIVRFAVSADRRNRHGDCTTLKCTDCHREFWMQEVE